MREGLVEVTRRMKGFAARDDISLESHPLQASFAGDDAPSFGVRALASQAPGMKILGIDGRDDTPVESLRSTLRRAASRRTAMNASRNFLAGGACTRFRRDRREARR